VYIEKRKQRPALRAGESTLSSAGQAEPELASPQEPDVPIKRSVSPDYIVCLDGKKLKMLKRHLHTSYG
jgi:predicted transcriptional regulator